MSTRPLSHEYDFASIDDEPCVPSRWRRSRRALTGQQRREGGRIARTVVDAADSAVAEAGVHGLRCRDCAGLRPPIWMAQLPVVLRRRTVPDAAGPLARAPAAGKHAGR